MIYVYALAFVAVNLLLGYNAARFMMGDKDMVASFCAFAMLIEFSTAIAGLVGGK